jgi:ABC-2 type transport system permease protein
MRIKAFASRNSKEILRDPLTLAFGVGMPIALMVLFFIIGKNVPSEAGDIFPIESTAPGLAVFSFSFISLFLGLLIAGDRGSSFLARIFASPLTPSDYILGYALPLLPIALLQTAFCYTAAFLCGLPHDAGTVRHVLVSVAVLVPVAVLYIGFGLLFGSIFTEKQVGGFFSIFVNLSAWLSGTWFSLDLMGGTIKSIGYALPFAHAVDAAKLAVAGEYGLIPGHLLWVTGYAVIIFSLAVYVFKKRMKN